MAEPPVASQCFPFSTVSSPRRQSVFFIFLVFLRLAPPLPQFQFGSGLFVNDTENSPIPPNHTPSAWPSGLNSKGIALLPKNR